MVNINHVPTLDFNTSFVVHLIYQVSDKKLLEQVWKRKKFLS